MNDSSANYSNNAIEYVIDCYKKGVLPKTLSNCSTHFYKMKESAPSPVDMEDPNYFNQLNDHINFKSANFQFHQAMVDVGVYAPISIEGCEILNVLLNDRQIVDPIAGRGFIAKGLRDLGANVLAGDHQPWNTVTEVLTIDAFELIKQANEDAVLLLAWPERGNLDYRLAKAWGDRDIITIGEPYGCTGSDKFIANFEAFAIDTPDDVLLHLNHEWAFGRFTKA